MLPVSADILLELSTVLKSKFGWQNAEIADVVRTIGYFSTPVKSRVTTREIADGPGNRVLECAVDGEADFIVSGDRHLLDMQSYRGIRILNARELLNNVTES